MFSMLLGVSFILLGWSRGFQEDMVDLAKDYFQHKRVNLLCYLSCDEDTRVLRLVKEFSKQDIRVSVKNIDKGYEDLEEMLVQWNVPLGVMLDGRCNSARMLLDSASQAQLFDEAHIWLVIDPAQYECHNDTTSFIDDMFQALNLSVDADITVAYSYGGHYELADVFNFGKIQGNHLEKSVVGTWSRGDGLNISVEGFKYYNRWDFHNLTLRAVTVSLDDPSRFRPELLEDIRYTAGISAMTKVVAQLLFTLKQQHNFRFNYTIASRWVGSPERNSTLAVTNSLYWREQDISCTCLRIVPQWLDWVDPFLPPATQLETKFYYLIPDKGVGAYENRFLSPLSNDVWWTICLAGILCMVVLTGAAAVEGRPYPGQYAVCSVLAAACQQAYDDGVHIFEEALSSQGRRLTILVIGLTSMVLYNYYTSSVVSWLLSAAAPTIASLDALIKSDLELIFEDIGYTQGWLDNPGFYYYSGYKNPKEDELRDKKVTKAKRKVPLLQSVADGIELIRTGAFAYHSEPYTASQVLSRALSARELCELGALQMMPPSHVYIMGQKRSPYKQFFTWSLMRVSERGQLRAARLRIGGTVPGCPGTSPRALALGQAAPALALLAAAALLAALLLFVEILWHRFTDHYNI